MGATVEFASGENSVRAAACAALALDKSCNVYLVTKLRAIVFKGARAIASSAAVAPCLVKEVRLAHLSDFPLKTSISLKSLHRMNRQCSPPP